MSPSEIQWTEETWNPVAGCAKVSAGCDNCYAIRLARRHDRPSTVYEGTTIPGPDWSGLVRTLPDRLGQPLRWREPRVVFVNSMSDLFHADVPREFIARIFAVMALTPRHTYQILTKRPGRMRHLMSDDLFWGEVQDAQHNVTFGDPTGAWPLPNVWLGVSVEDQHHADTRIPELLRTPAAIRFLSCEPLLEHVDVGPWLRASTCTRCGEVLLTPGGCACGSRVLQSALHWLIVGGESGSGSRPFRIEWARSLTRQCREAGCACFVKQLGANIIDRNDCGFEDDYDGAWPWDPDAGDQRYDENLYGYRDDYQGADIRIRLHDRKGGDWDEWPRDLRIREMPNRAFNEGRQ